MKEGEGVKTEVEVSQLTGGSLDNTINNPNKAPRGSAGSVDSFALSSTPNSEESISPNNTTILEGHCISKWYGGKEGIVLRDVNVAVGEGEVLAIIGKTGSGKTTLLKILAGFETPSRGTVTYQDSVIYAPRKEIGYIFQRPTLFPWMNVEENIAFALRTVSGKDMTKDQIHIRVTEWIRNVNLAGSELKFPYQLSGGMQSRVAIARTLVYDPKIILMDEPFGALDAITKSNMHQLMFRIFASTQKVAAIIVTHDIEEALLLSDRVLVLSTNGEVSLVLDSGLRIKGDYETIITSPELINLKAKLLKVLAD